MPLTIADTGGLQRYPPGSIRLITFLPFEIGIGVVSAKALRVLANISGFRAGFWRRQNVVKLALGTNGCGEIVVVDGSGGGVGPGRRCARA